MDGNLKMTLGMIWTIILRFAIQDIAVEGNFWFTDAFSKARKCMRILSVMCFIFRVI